VPAPVVALVGATATGKTALAEALADALDADVVCADSRQVFRELEVGTGKPTRATRATRPHHLFDALALEEPASAGWFGRAAGEVLAAIAVRGRRAVLVGGSGLYLRAAQEGLSDVPPVDPEVRARLRRELEAVGAEVLHARWASRDPEGAARVAPRDRQRVVRALEILESSGHPPSWWHGRGPAARPHASWIVLELVVEPSELVHRIAARTRDMLAHGLLEEADALRRAGREAALRALRAVGYDEALDALAGAITAAEAEARINARTARLAKRQRTWFRHQVEAVRLPAGGADAPRLLERAAAAVRAANAGTRD
jgi:tRNA dimethylallyltransferase